jgi:NADH-quinone oxidoreductase subunit G
MPRPRTQEIQFTIDGREVTAIENTMLVDAAKLGDVEIPVFCYEPKLGAPVGACRMCLVEVEGIPKLQTACSTPVKDGMVVNTQTDRVQEAQRAVVEFLLINHPLDCPVCDKGGECPLQDISFGWGSGHSRFVEPKRHFEKPIALSPLIAIDRERCIMCYRCVRFSQELSEDYQLVLRERAAQTYVATFDGTPYVAPFSGNITELCPVGALTSQAYRFRARPWDIEQAGSVCTLCPSQCNVSYTVRDDRVLRVLARPNHDIDDGWLCDRGRFAYQSSYSGDRVTTPMVRDGGQLRPASWERALDEAAGALRRAGENTGLIAGGGTVSEVGVLAARIAREALGSANIDSRARDRSDAAVTAALRDAALQAKVPDLEFAHTVLVLGVEPIDEAPILELRIRKGVRRNRVRLVVATARPSALDAKAEIAVRLAPGDEPRVAAQLAFALAGGEAPDDINALAQTLRDGGDDVVVLYGERVLADPAGGAALVEIAQSLGLSGRDGAGLLGVPAFANGRGLAEAGVVPFDGDGLDSAGMAAAAARGELAALWLLNVDPADDLPGGELWDTALERASSVVAHAAFLTPGIAEHANVVLPVDLDGERDGTVTHPDGTVQRVRQGVARVGDVQPGWWVMQELGRRLGVDPGLVGPPITPVVTQPAADGTKCSPPANISSRGVPEAGPAPVGSRLRLGTFRTAWDGAEAQHAPALAFLSRETTIELSPADAERVDVRNGSRAAVTSDGGARIEATVLIRSDVPVGSTFLSAELLDGPLVSVDALPTPPAEVEASSHGELAAMDGVS